jgi:hypothetical protein
MPNVALIQIVSPRKSKQLQPITFQ